MTGTSRRRAALATFAGSGTTVAITVAQAFILIPLALRYLGAPLYGAWLAASELLIWIQMLDFGIPGLVMQRVGAALGRGDTDVAARWSSTGFVLVAALAVALLAAGLGVAPWVPRWMGVPSSGAADFIGAFRLGAFASALLLLFSACAGLSRGVQRTAVVSVAQVSGALAGLVVAAGLLLAGYGLWALPIGLLVRAVVSLVGGLVFIARLPGSPGAWVFRPSRAALDECRAIGPSVAVASVSRVVGGNSEVLIVTAMFGPAAAAVYGLTRRAMDGLRHLLDAIAWATSGGFAHLVTAHDRHRAHDVLGEILWLRLAAASLGAGVIIAINRPFVETLFGSEQFGGVLLTALFGAHVVLGGQALLMNALYRAAGYVREGSILATAETVARAMAMVAGLALIGLPGAPLGAVAVSTVTLAVLGGRLRQALAATGPATVAARRGMGAAAVLAVGLVSAAFWRPGTWPLVAATALGISAVGAWLLWAWSDARDRTRIRHWIASLPGFG